MNLLENILLPGKSFDSYIGHNVINLSDTPLTEPQVSALEKDLTFCPTPNKPDKPKSGMTLKPSTEG